jgi:hypothetical protein
MKALLFVTYTLLHPGGHPQTFNSMNEVDGGSCRDSMMQVMEQYDLKNHVYSDGPTYMKAHDQFHAVIVTCRTAGK